MSVDVQSTPPTVGRDMHATPSRRSKLKVPKSDGSTTNPKSMPSQSDIATKIFKNAGGLDRLTSRIDDVLKTAEGDKSGNSTSFVKNSLVKAWGHAFGPEVSRPESIKDDKYTYNEGTMGRKWKEEVQAICSQAQTHARLIRAHDRVTKGSTHIDWGRMIDSRLNAMDRGMGSAKSGTTDFTYTGGSRTSGLDNTGKDRLAEVMREGKDDVSVIPGSAVGGSESRTPTQSEIDQAVTDSKASGTQISRTLATAQDSAEQARTKLTNKAKILEKVAAMRAKGNAKNATSETDASQTTALTGADSARAPVGRQTEQDPEMKKIVENAMRRGRTPKDTTASTQPDTGTKLNTASPSSTCNFADISRKYQDYQRDKIGSTEFDRKTAEWEAKPETEKNAEISSVAGLVKSMCDEWTKEMKSQLADTEFKVQSDGTRMRDTERQNENIKMRMSELQLQNGRQERVTETMTKLYDGGLWESPNSASTAPKSFMPSLASAPDRTSIANTGGQTEAESYQAMANILTGKVDRPAPSSRTIPTGGTLNLPRSGLASTGSCAPTTAPSGTQKSVRFA